MKPVFPDNGHDGGAGGARQCGRSVELFPPASGESRRSSRCPRRNPLGRLAQATIAPQDSTAARMWMFGVAKNVLKHVERGNARRFRLASELRNVAALQTAGTQSDEAIDVRNAIACLSPKLTELIRLVHWDGFTLAEAATLQGIPASTARSRYAQARKILSARLRAMDSREDPLAPVLGVALTSVHEEGS